MGYMVPCLPNGGLTENSTSFQTLPRPELGELIFYLEERMGSISKTTSERAERSLKLSSIMVCCLEGNLSTLGGGGGGYGEASGFPLPQAGYSAWRRRGRL